jgi:hypothetical protein
VVPYIDKAVVSNPICPDLSAERTHAEAGKLVREE